MYYIAVHCLRLPYSSLCCFTFSIHYQTLPFIANSKRLHYVAIFCLTLPYIRCLILPNIAFRCGHISLNCLVMHSRTASAQGKARALGCNHIVVLGWQLHKLVSQSQCGGNAHYCPLHDGQSQVQYSAHNLQNIIATYYAFFHLFVTTLILQLNLTTITIIRLGCIDGCLSRNRLPHHHHHNHHHRHQAGVCWWIFVAP